VSDHGTLFVETEALLAIIEGLPDTAGIHEAREMVEGMSLQATLKLKDAAYLLFRLVQDVAVERTLRGDFTDEALQFLRSGWEKEDSP
jgi:hypothetical protein